MTLPINQLPPAPPQPHPSIYAAPPKPEPSRSNFLDHVHPQIAPRSLPRSLQGRVALCPDCKIAHPECKVQ